MSYVSQAPHSNTNSSSDYRVVDYDKWVAYCDGEISFLPVAATATSWETANAIRDDLNRKAS